MFGLNVDRSIRSRAARAGAQNAPALRRTARPPKIPRRVWPAPPHNARGLPPRHAHAAAYNLRLAPLPPLAPPSPHLRGLSPLAFLGRPQRRHSDASASRATHNDASYQRGARGLCNGCADAARPCGRFALRRRLQACGRWPRPARADKTARGCMGGFAPPMPPAAARFPSGKAAAQAG